MKLEPPLANLVSACETICVAGCCGLNAYDFSPIQIAYYLILHRSVPYGNLVETILNQLAVLQNRANHSELTIEEMNQIFTKDQMDELVREITANI